MNSKQLLFALLLFSSNLLISLAQSNISCGANGDYDQIKKVKQAKKCIIRQDTMIKYAKILNAEADTLNTKWVEIVKKLEKYQAKKEDTENNVSMKN